MPLRDHFHPPVSDLHSWTTAHGVWAVLIGLRLNQELPAGYFAEPLTKFGIEIDVAALDIRRNGTHPTSRPAVDWPVMPTQTITRLSTLTDEVGVRIYAGGARRLLVAAIEIVSPANKDRDETRDAFLAKCLNVLRSGAGLMVIDMVTERHFNLHDALLQRWGGPQEQPFPGDLYAVAYRPILTDDGTPPRLTVWSEALAIGGPLPTLPLWLLGVGAHGIDLEATYEQALRQLRYDAE